MIEYEIKNDVLFVIDFKEIHEQTSYDKYQPKTLLSST